MNAQGPDPSEETPKGKPFGCFIVAGASCLLLTVLLPLLGDRLSDKIGYGLPCLLIVACPLLFAVICLYFGIKGRRPKQ
jgi:hypothetical protein